ncbi:sensor histidine kinase [Marinagarivorans algicola]|uniref:sensor histidine kinase n=1 Tax=Marinagarivorans algicola TaxID=1513270 RepID=UPI0006B906F6|nr:HAMP domain-containing sensor histidine kinase [Marinagarivorans algicola]
MLKKMEFVQANIMRTAAVSRWIAQIAAWLNFAFLILAITSHIWPRVVLLSIAQCGFIACIYYSEISRFSAKVPWLLLASCWFAVANAVLTNGAGMGHVTVLWFVILVCIAGLLGGLRFGLYWGGIGGMSILVVAVCEMFKVPIPNFTPEPQRYTLIVMHTIAQMACMVGIIAAYTRALEIYQRQVEEQILAVTKEVEQRKKAEVEAQLLAKNKEQFLRNISHEFRTPLNSIIGFSERLLKKCCDMPELVKPLSAINRNGKSLHYFVSELLLLDAIEATPLQRTRACPAELVHSCCELYRDLALEHELALRLTIEPACLQFFVMLDVARMSQALNNILLFCIRQSSRGVIQLRVEYALDALVITFEDNAQALTHSQKEHLFETHYEYVLSNDKDVPCSAFALKIAGMIMGYHNWSVEVECGESECGEAVALCTAEGLNGPDHCQQRGNRFVVSVPLVMFSQV